MVTNYEAATILAVLLPGFVASGVLSAILIRKKPSGLDRVVEAFVLSFVIYGITYAVLGLRPVEPVVSDLGRMVVKREFVAVALVLSFVLPLVAGWIHRRDLHMRILRRLRITHKTSRDTAWLDVFVTQDRYVICNLASGRRVFGWPMFYSTTPEEGLIYLFDPAWVAGGDYIDLPVHGILLTGKDPIESIEFTNTTAQTARETTNARAQGQG